MDRPADTPDTLWQGVLEKVRRLEQREFAYRTYTQPLFETMFPPYIEGLQRDLYTSFSANLDDTNTPRIPATRVGLDTIDLWVEDLDDMLSAVEDAWSEGLQDDMVAAHDEAWWIALWLIEQQDPDVFDTEDALAPDDALPYIIASAIGGISYLSRAEAWRAHAVEKFRQQMRAAAVSDGATWDHIQQTIQTVLDQYRYGLTALGADELYFASVLGERRAVDSFIAAGSRALWLWLTRDDEKVCSKCSPLHGTYTDLIPVLDTHPLCRCVIVPRMPDTDSGTMLVPYETFRQRHT